MLLLFGIVYGIMTGGVTVLRARFATTLTQGCSDPSQELVLFGIMRFLGGVGGISGGFVGSSFVPDINQPFDAGYAGGSWTTLILFTGILFLVTGLGYAGKWIPARRSLDALKCRNAVSERSLSPDIKLPDLPFEANRRSFVIWCDECGRFLEEAKLREEALTREIEILKAAAVISARS